MGRLTLAYSISMGRPTLAYSISMGTLMLVE
jgi:hypothetical protein